MIKLRFNWHYFIAFVLVLALEVLIALFVRDEFVRPYVGDILVVVLLYCFLKAFVHINNALAVTIVLVFACMVELLQYLHFVSLLALKNNELARTVLGTSFSWIDVAAYGVGAVICAVAERNKRR